MTCGEKKNINENGEGVHKELQFGQGCFTVVMLAKKALRFIQPCLVCLKNSKDPNRTGVK